MFKETLAMLKNKIWETVTIQEMSENCDELDSKEACF